VRLKKGYEPTHCSRGHKYTPENLYRRPGKPNLRICKKCKNERNRKYRYSLTGPHETRIMTPPSWIKEYTGLPCVYIRWIESEQAFYIGQTINLTERYTNNKLQEVFYFEEYQTEDETIVRERILIGDFLSSGLPLANVRIEAFTRYKNTPHRHYRPSRLNDL
jgi:hypothetical protein